MLTVSLPEDMIEGMVRPWVDILEGLAGIINLQLGDLNSLRILSTGFALSQWV
jgi:hypothetical protein